MCDTVVFVPEEGPVWFAKNSDREPSEAQHLECHRPEQADPGVPNGLPQRRSRRALLSRPSWMWGAEMGVNEHGVAIGNQAVFTRFHAFRRGHSGMDFLRVALQACRSADDALEQLIDLVERYDQGGRMGHRHRSFRYHSAFVIADSGAAWVLETAGRFWAAKRVRGVATLSNVLSIGYDFDRVHDRAVDFARARGWVDGDLDFHFARAFSHRAFSALSGGEARSACTKRSLTGLSRISTRELVRTLCDHAGAVPGEGWRSQAPCAHASWVPTKRAAQTTASLVACLREGSPHVWATGTSSPCLSVFKPAPLDEHLFAPRPIAESTYDPEDLWWRHERLHRICLPNYQRSRVTFAEERERFQDECLNPAAQPKFVWERHAELVEHWVTQARRVNPRQRASFSRAYWSSQSRFSAVPG